MERNLRKTRVGTVVSDKMDKTIVVAVKDSVQHPLYKKILKRTKKFKAHDENNEAGIGDRVEIMETRKISKEVNWRLDKTIVVAVKDSVQHPLYKKILKRTKKFKAHDENNEAGIGDRVEIMETRKLSKDVNWRLVKIVEKAK